MDRGKLFVVLILLSVSANCQKLTFQANLGLRDEATSTKVNEGYILHVREARLVLDGTLDIKLDDGWSIPIGVSIQRYGNRTVIERTVDFGSQLNWQTLPLFHIGLKKVVFSIKKVDFLVGLNQQVLIIPGKEKTIDYNFSLSDDFENFPGKSEKVYKLRTVNPITQLSLRAELKVNKKRKVFIAQSYNYGWYPILERRVLYRVGDLSPSTSKFGDGVVTTNGSGWQIDFGMIFPIK